MLFAIIVCAVLFFLTLMVIGVMFIADVTSPELPFGTPVTITHGVFRGRQATTEQRSWASYLVAIQIDEEQRTVVQWIRRSDFIVREK